MWAPKYARDIEQLGLALDGRFVGPAGQVEMKPAVAQVLQQRARAVDQQLRRRGSRRSASPAVRAPMCASSRRRYSCLYQSGSRGWPPRSLDPLGELDHLVDRLLAVEPHDVVEHHLPDLVVGLAGQAREGLDEHRHHDLGPPLADQRERAVEVEEDVADLGPRLQRRRAARRCSSARRPRRARVGGS